jgi:glucosylceramidase
MLSHPQRNANLLASLFPFALFLLLLASNCCGGGAASSPPPPPATATPSFWPIAGSYSPIPVTISDATSGSAIYYTTDGTTPTTASNRYTLPVALSTTSTLQAIALAPGFSQSAVASASYTIAPHPDTGAAVSIVLTTDDQNHLMESQAGIHFTTAAGGSNLIVVDETQTYQQIEGFGASMTDSAAYLLNQVATPSARTAAMNDLFTRAGSGIGISFLRNPMAASDLARNLYSYDDNAGQSDPTLANFSIAHDQQDIIPLIVQARQLNPQLKTMATPWSPPGWMKDSGSMIGGSLLTASYDAFANYFVRYIQAYQAAGIPIDYISLQNEPLYTPGDYGGMCMPAAPATLCNNKTWPSDQLTALRDHVLPALAAKNLTTRVLVYDHNWDVPTYPDAVLSDLVILASNQVAGTAWHGYAGTPGVMTTLHNKFPAKGNYQTEHSGGTWVSDQVKEDFEEITQVMRNWSKVYVKWGLALDQNRDPHSGGCGTCSPLVTVNTSTGAVTRAIDYYTLGHFSRFVLPGASRVYSSNARGVVSAAFLNPDSSKAIVVYNDTNAPNGFQVQWGTQSFTYTLPALSGATFTWTGTQSGSYTLNAKAQIQASSFNTSAGMSPSGLSGWGLQTEASADTDHGYDVAFASARAYAVYRHVDFSTGPGGVAARLACDQTTGGNCGGTLEFHLDSPTGALIGTVTIPSTSGWQTWTTTTAPVSGASGVHDLYVIFKAPPSGPSALGNLNWFQFN